MTNTPRPPDVLCQPDETKSCGACCGMYNLAGLGPNEVWSRLRVRTSAFRATANVQDEESLRDFRAQWEVLDGKLVGGLPNCPFLGLIDERRVGCLVHPLQNEGVDGRDCGVYDRHTCEDYLCAAHAVMRPIEKWLAIEGCEDSYTYGLVVTDPLFVKQLFEQAAQMNGAMPTADRVMRSPESARAYFSLKRDFPYRAADGVLGQVHGSEALDTPRRQGPAESIGVEPDRWETILRCLGTQVADASQLAHARALVQGAVAEFARAMS